MVTHRSAPLIGLPLGFYSDPPSTPNSRVVGGASWLHAGPLPGPLVLPLGNPSAALSVPKFSPVVVFVLF